MTIEQSVLLIPDKAKLQSQYTRLLPGYESVLREFLEEVAPLLASGGLKPTLKGRVKDFESYYSKKLRLLKKAWTEKSGPLPVNDVIAIRVVCPFLGDLGTAEKILAKHYEVEEIERMGAERSFREFGYESIHVLVRLPERFQPRCPQLDRGVIEIQLRTILQEAWAEVEHELVYKAEFTPFDEPMRRKLAALNANLTLSDIIFQEILEFEKRLNTELGHRREAFYRRIEEVSMDAGSGGTAEQDLAPPPADRDFDSLGALGMDGLFLAALEAHNKAEFDRAIDIYSAILGEQPEKEIASVVFKHRGMAFFAQNKYGEALEDFSSCLAMEPSCYKALYYRGVVKSIQDDLGGASDDFTSALEIHPYHFYSRYRRAATFFRLGDIAGAHADCELALRIEPKNPLALHLMDRIKAAMAKNDF
ncbi:MAG: RelA/SpoT domain-containing protein [Spirochaetes bacterium]|nr:MAG: RelA/SpoT domain-containing protein [Spirochaetota bacterium]